MISDVKKINATSRLSSSTLICSTVYFSNVEECKEFLLEGLAYMNTPCSPNSFIAYNYRDVPQYSNASSEKVEAADKTASEEDHRIRYLTQKHLARKRKSHFQQNFSDNVSVDMKYPYDAVDDYRRIGLIAKDGQRPTAYRIFTNNYKLSPTYPSKFVVPSKVNDEMLKEIAKYRSKARVPAVTWIHSRSRGVIVRCAQPMRAKDNAAPKTHQENH